MEISIVELLLVSLSRSLAGLLLSPPLTHTVLCSAHSIIHQLTDAPRGAERKGRGEAEGQGEGGGVGGQMHISSLYCCSLLAPSPHLFSKVTIPSSSSFHLHPE